ncbi:MAG: CAP domain-containing protein [Chloroflexi bacterium]|nr:CAP domain-containing protein [Chloroflexota bacterium]
MKTKSAFLLCITFVAALLLAGCTAPLPTPTPALTVTAAAAPTLTPTLAPTATTPPLPPMPTATPAAEIEPSATQAPAETAAPTAETPAPTPTPLPADDCREIAAFFGDITIPDDTFFKQDEAFTKTWRFRNESDCAWTTAYKIVFHSGEIMSGPLSQPLPVEVPPGGIVDLSLELRAPTRGGPHQGFWWFEDPSGERFGAGSARTLPFWVRIAVRYLDENDQPQGDPAAAPPTPPPGCAAQRDASVEAQVLALINQARQAADLAALSSHPALAEAAFVHSRDMACNGFVDHSGSDGSSWYDRVAAQGYAYSNANENIYVGFPEFGGTAQGAVTWWLNSQVHKDNILNAGNIHAGVGYVYDAASEWGGYYTVVFARP